MGAVAVGHMQDWRFEQKRKQSESHRTGGVRYWTENTPFLP